MGALFGGGRRRPISRSGEFWGRWRGGNTGRKRPAGVGCRGARLIRGLSGGAAAERGGGGGLGKKREGHGRAARGSGEDVDKRGRIVRGEGGHVATLAIPKRRLVPARRLVYIKLRG